MTPVGVLGGTFDPVHVGHTTIARAMHEALGLSRVDLVPSFQPPHRPGRRPAEAWHRFAMLALATSGEPNLRCSDREIRRGGVSYMLETLRGYAADEPDAVPVLILGLDAFADLPSWREPEALVREFALAVATRPGWEAEPVVRGLPGWLTERIVPAPPAGRPPAPGGVAIVRAPARDVSASAIRLRLSRGEPIEGLVAPAVAAYIDKHRIYEG